MYADNRPDLFSRQSSRQPMRSGLLIAVVGVHVIIAYLLSISMGVIKAPSILEASNVIFIPEPQQTTVEPEIPDVKPDIVQPQVIDNPMPQIELPAQIEAPVTDMPPSETAPIATAPIGSQGAPAQELKTRTRVDPVYPPSSRRAGEEGTVRLRILVDERGLPHEVQLAQGSGFPRLDQAAIDAVRKWRFVAASSGGQAVSTWTQVAVTFRLTTENR